MASCQGLLNNLVKRRRRTGSIAPLPQGNKSRNSQIAPRRYWILLWLGSNADATIDDVVAALRSHRGYASSRTTVWRAMSRDDLTNKKKSQRAAEQLRSDVVAARLRRPGSTRPDLSKLLQSPVFIDETSVKTNMVRARGWAPRGKMLVGYAPHGHWLSQTFIAGLRWNHLGAPSVIDGSFNGELFGVCCEMHLAPALTEGDIAILDNPSSHKSTRAARLSRPQEHGFYFFRPTARTSTQSRWLSRRSRLFCASCAPVPTKSSGRRLGRYDRCLRKRSAATIWRLLAIGGEDD